MTDEAEVTRSDLLMPIFSKEIEIHADKSVGRRTFYLADTEAFEGPCCAIPDIGGPPNKYFVVLPRNEWNDPFIQWIEDPHTLDEMDDMDVKTEVEEHNILLVGRKNLLPRKKIVPLGEVERPKRPKLSL